MRVEPRGGPQLVFHLVDWSVRIGTKTLLSGVMGLYIICYNYILCNSTIFVLVNLRRQARHLP